MSLGVAGGEAGLAAAEAGSDVAVARDSADGLSAGGGAGTSEARAGVLTSVGVVGAGVREATTGGGAWGR